MQDVKKVLSPFLQAVVFLFAAFGGTLTKIAPPDQVRAGYAVGIASFLVLIVLLLTSALGAVKSPAKRKLWIAAGGVAFVVALPAVVLYPTLLEQHTFTYPVINPTITRVNGSVGDLQPDAADYYKQHSHPRPADLLQNFTYDQIWTPKSIQYFERILLVTYLWLVLSIAIAIFCLVEVTLGKASG